MDLSVTTYSSEDRARLLGLARSAITAAVGGGAMPEVSGGVFDDRAGAFVTLHSSGRLRGCIGQTQAKRLADVISHCAVAAAFDDPRFPPVTADEVAQLVIELSILSPLERLDDPTKLEVGRHGLAVSFDGRRGLLLPQVAVEWDWTARTFLEQTCVKAGLPPDAWQRGAQLHVFEAEIFSEP